MITHPFPQSIWDKGVSVLWISALVLSLAGLLALYGETTWPAIVTDTLVYSSLFSLFAYLYRYVYDYLRGLSVKIALALLVQLVCLLASCSALLIPELEDPWVVSKNIPLHLIVGLSFWMILTQWYGSLRQGTEAEQEMPLPVQETGEEKEEVEKTECIDRISVKDGNEIHLIKTDSLLYIQAYGDYVMLYSEQGKFIKEQTMKYFESVLPGKFIRIHRSSIVNTERITRVELFGKESYSVILNNGTSLRASKGGYRLLKEKLAL